MKWHAIRNKETGHLVTISRKEFKKIPKDHEAITFIYAVRINLAKAKGLYWNDDKLLKNKQATEDIRKLRPYG